MNTTRALVAALVLTLTAGLGAVSASAHTKSDVGIYAGDFNVGKFGSCPQSGAGTVAGPGLGLLVMPDGQVAQKKLFWTLRTDESDDLPGFFSTVQHPVGLTLKACGRMAPENWTFKDTPGVPKRNLGAACGWSSGYNGWGTIELLGVPHYRLRELHWPIALGDVLPIVGHLWVFSPDGKDGKKTIGYVSLLTEIPRDERCLTKTSNSFKSPDSGQTQFDAVGIFAAHKFKGTPGAATPCQKKGQEVAC